VPVVVGGRREAAEVLAMAARGGVVETRVRVVAMAALADVFGEMERGEVVGRVVVDLGRVE
jgi:D-arabinose 1-dehydrogenase-like Zn-dependent alcohol dehydrogenase